MALARMNGLGVSWMVPFSSLVTSASVLLRLGFVGAGSMATPLAINHGSVADDLNSLYNDEDGGVLLRIIGEGWTRPWEGCERWDDPCSKYARVGRLSFLILNRLYWNDTTSRLMLPEDGILEPGVTSDMGYIGSETARNRATRCMFTIDGWTEFRFREGCGCTTQSEKYVKLGPLKNFSQHQTDGWQGDCHQPDNQDWCTATKQPRTVPLSSSTVECPERFGCAWRAAELPSMMRDYKANREFIPSLCEQWNEVVVDSTLWNKGLSHGAVRAFFIRKDKCMPGTKCYTDFLRWSGEFAAEHGEVPVFELDVKNKETPFKVHSVVNPPSSVVHIDLV
eukprot:TRINITY_DN2382_c0_g1_i3.p1 TRINITY_DN2382_c0_g1~~TRINITY_DN2382_c0_g1_i3.p1  ORF type:complete len:359 (-),score=34.03 TRINITY_DN2382_c0_g1_i3:171-1181(-)